MGLKSLLNSKLLRTSGLYTIANILNASIPFLLIPVLTRNMSKADYGMVAMFTMMVSFVGPFIGLSVHGAISRKYYSQDQDNFPRYVGNCFFLLAGSTILVTIIFLIFNRFISFYTALPPVWLFAVIAISFGQFIILCLLTIWQMKIKPISYGVFQILQTALNFGLTAWLVIQLQRNWEGRMEAQLLAVIVFAILGLVILYYNKWIKLEYNKEDLKHALQFSLPLIPHTIGGLLVTMTDRFFIKNLVGMDETGLYMVAFQIGNVLNLLMTSFINAYVPWLYDNLNKNELAIKAKIVKLTYLIFAGLIVIPFICQLLLPWFLGFFVGRSFEGVTPYAFWLIVGYAFNGMYLMVAGFIFYIEKTKYLAYVTFSVALINIPLCYALIKINGAIGAAQATAIIFFLTFIFTWYLSAKVYAMPWFKFLKK